MVLLERTGKSNESKRKSAAAESGNRGYQKDRGDQGWGVCKAGRLHKSRIRNLSGTHVPMVERCVYGEKSACGR